jgi:phosphoribosyl-ATP pyrophosphohydrolase/phosphoribosyl-AMP cyclohydrolase
MSTMKHTGLLILNPDGTAAEATICNEKSRVKTVERDELWIVDPTTHRVLPYQGGGVAIDGPFVDRGGWFAVQLVTAVDRTGDVSGYRSATGPSERKGGHHHSPSGDGPRTKEAILEKRTSRLQDASTPDHGAGDSTGVSTTGTVLSTLTQVIKERHATMPEGSYTTHLFSKGIDKIRKKTGEEAVELILAQDNGEIAAEGADLIYHMMVLLEAAGMSIDDVITVLQERHTSG